MYYRHDGEYLIVQKSNEPLTGDNVLYCEEDFYLELYDVIVGYVGTDLEKDNVILKHTKRIKSNEMLLRRLSSIEEQQAEYSLDLDFRLSMLELGLI